jgi:hypothetical protein
MFSFFIVYSLLICIYIVWAISLAPLCHLLLPLPTPLLPGRTCSTLLSNFVEEKT